MKISPYNFGTLVMGRFFGLYPGNCVADDQKNAGRFIRRTHPVFVTYSFRGAEASGRHFPTYPSWLGDEESNLDRQIQNLPSCR